MNIQIFENEKQVHEACAIIFAAQLIENPESVLGFATGSTPVGAYSELIRLHEEGIISFANAMTFNLDEYVGLEQDHDQSYHRFMMENLFDLVDIPEENIHVPYGAAPDPEVESLIYDNAIAEAGGVDLQLLGIGINGHIGFNEPSASFSGETHVVDLAPSTIEANSRFFESADDVPRFAITMGIGTIMSALKIVLVATGEKKAQAIKDMIDGPIDPQCPASILQLHDDITVLLDMEAASLLL